MGWNVDRAFALARERGWNDAEFARRMGVAESTVNRVRRGLQQPSLRFQLGLERAFPDADVRRLMHFEEQAS